MGFAAILSLLLAAGTADDLVPFSLHGFQLKVPAAWSHTEDEGTHRYQAPSGDSAFEFSVLTVEGEPRSAAVCVDQLVAVLGGKGWVRMRVGDQPAVRKDTRHRASDGGTHGFLTRDYVGCNGRFKWAITFSMREAKKQRYAAFADKVVHTVRYPPAPAP